MAVPAQHRFVRAGLSGDLLFELTPEGSFLSLRPSFRASLGLSEVECLGKTFADLLHPGDEDVVRTSLVRAAKGEATAVSGVRLLAGKGPGRSWDLTFVPRIENGSVVSLLALGESAGGPPSLPATYAAAPLQADQQALLHLLELFLANAPVGFCFLDERLKFLCVNQTLAGLIGYAPEQHLGRTLQDLVPELSRKAEPVLRRVMATGQAELNLEIPFPGPPGSETLWGSASCYPVGDRDGKVVGVGLLVLDVTDRRRIETELRESEDRFRLAIEAAQIGTWDWNITADRLTWSNRSKAMCGLPPDAYVNWQVFLDSLHPEDRPLVEESVRKALAEPDTPYLMEYRTIGIRDGVERYLSVRGRVYRDHTGKPRRFVGIAADVTDQKRSEELRRRLSVELERSNDELRRFAAAASHDLQEPLRTVMSFLDLLTQRSRDQMDVASRRYLELAASGTRRMQRLIEDLLQYTRLEAHQPRKGHVDLNQVFRETLLNLRTSLAESGAQVGGDTLPVVVGDRSQLGQLLLNLIGNAVKYRRREVPPMVYLSVRRQGEEWVFRVKDNGIGFEPAEAERIFESFHRLHGWEEYAGSGLGLATCRRILDRHGGRIWAESEPGKGSVFSFTLPA